VRIKTAARKYADLPVEAPLQLSIYRDATAMNGLADREDLRRRFDVLTKTKKPAPHRLQALRGLDLLRVTPAQRCIGRT